MPDARTALLIMDVQPEIVARFGDPGVTDRLARAATAARAAGVLVIYVTVGCRPGHPEISPRNRQFAPIAQAMDSSRACRALCIPHWHPTATQPDANTRSRSAAKYASET